MRGFPKKRYAYGIDWGNWSVGFQTVTVKEYGFVVRISLFPIVFYWTIKEFKGEKE